MRAVHVVLLLGLIFAVAGAALWYLWNQVADAEISAIGMWMLIGGGVITLGLGVGLMALVYHSHKSGHDDRIDDR